MNDYKNKPVLMAAAYIIMILCLVSTACSGIVVAYNLSNQYYSAGGNVSDDIRLMCLDTAYVAVNKAIENGGYYEYDKGGNVTGLMKKDLASDELISGESRSGDFGYVIKEGANVIKRVNPELIKSYSSDSMNIAKRTYHIDGTEYATEFRGDYTIDIYIGDIAEGEIPEYLSRTAVPLMLMNKYRMPAAVILVLSSVAALILLVVLTVSAYRKKNGRCLRYIPLDILAVAAAVIVTAAAIYALSLEEFNMDMMVAELTLCVVVAAVAVTGWILLFAARAGQGKWWHSTAVFFILSKAAGLLKWIGRQVGAIVSGLPVVWKTTILYLAAAFVNLMILIIAMSLYSPGAALLLWMVGFVVTGMFVLLTAIRMKAVKTGAERIAAGDLEYQIDEKGMYLDLREHVETLNNIREGLSVAFDEKLRSERMKTELITNVSHDIKTPLTSIINYIDFLKKEELGSDKAAEYVNVLDRQSQRLKKLIEDLTEASKASTGNVKIELEPCDAGVMMTQVMGEYQEKAEKADLSLILDIPDSSVMIMADGRQLWRILNNLMNNICKYSMPGTRVYQKLEIDGEKAVITYRNISKYELNISPDELTERFVRGDSSRHTEGSGLGLSIAQNLTELQNGDFSIDIDGDLFKVTVIFETIRIQ